MVRRLAPLGCVKFRFAEDDSAFVIPWAFSPRTRSVGKAGIYLGNGHRPEPVLGLAEGGPGGRCDGVGGFVLRH